MKVFVQLSKAAEALAPWCLVVAGFVRDGSGFCIASKWWKAQYDLKTSPGLVMQGKSYPHKAQARVLNIWSWMFILMEVSVLFFC